MQRPAAGCVLQILLADDHAFLRKGVREVLETRSGWAVCGEARDGAEALELAEILRPDVAIVDLGMPGMNGLETTRRIREASPATEVIVFTGHDSPALPDEAAAAGARAYLLKSCPPDRLLAAIDEIAADRPAAGRSGGGGRAAGERARLTEREREVVRLLADGKDNAAVAIILGIGVRTVETHRAHAMRKLGLESVVELVHYAVRNLLVDP